MNGCGVTIGGDVLAVLPEGAPIPMFKFMGLIKAKWTDNEDGTHTELLYDTSSFLHRDTEEILDVFANPITEKKNDVIHVWDGPTTRRSLETDPFIPGRPRLQQTQLFFHGRW